MNGNLNASSVAEALPSMDPSVAQWFLMQMLKTGGFGTTLPMNLKPYYAPGSMPQTGANVPSSSVGFPKIYLKTLRIKLLNIIFRFQGTSDGSSLHHKPSELKSLKLINCLITIIIIVFKKSKRVGSMVDRRDDDKNGLNKLQTVTITIDLTLKNCPKFKLQTVTITIDLTLNNEFGE